MEKRSCLLPGYLVFRRLSEVFLGNQDGNSGMELGTWIRSGFGQVSEASFPAFKWDMG